MTQMTMSTARRIVPHLSDDEKAALRALTSPSVYLESLRRESFRRDQRQKNFGRAFVLMLIVGAIVGALLA